MYNFNHLYYFYIATKSGGVNVAVQHLRVSQPFELSEEMGELLSTKVPSASRRIHIGVSDEVDHPFVIEVVSLFLKKHGLAQRPKVTVVSGTHAHLAERLRFRELDAVVTQLTMIEPELE